MSRQCTRVHQVWPSSTAAAPIPASVPASAPGAPHPPAPPHPVLVVQRHHAGLHVGNQDGGTLTSGKRLRWAASSRAPLCIIIVSPAVLPGVRLEGQQPVAARPLAHTRMQQTGQHPAHNPARCACRSTAVQCCDLSSQAAMCTPCPSRTQSMAQADASNLFPGVLH